MATKNRWPAITHNFREDGVSFRVLPEPELGDILKVCNHYLEMLTLYGKEKEDRDHHEFVRQSIEEIQNQVRALVDKDREYQKRSERIKQIEEEFSVLLAGDLDTDPQRTPQSMHDKLIALEGQHVMLKDAISSYERQLKMLEKSIDPAVDKKRFL